MGQGAQFQFQTAPQQYYNTSNEAEVANVSPGSHQGTDFTGLVNPVDFRRKQQLDETPVGDGLYFLVLSVIAWQAIKAVHKKIRKIVPIVLFVFVLGEVSARDVVWKYSFMDGTFTSVSGRTYQSRQLCGRKIKMANNLVSHDASTNTWNASCAASCSFVRGLGMKIEPSGSYTDAYVDFIDSCKYDYVKTITFHFTYPVSTTQNTSDIYLREYLKNAYDNTWNKKNRRNSFVKTTPYFHQQISQGQGEQTVSFNVNSQLAEGWIVHLELHDIFYLRSIEVEYEDNAADNPDLNKPCHKFYSDGVLTHQFVDHLGISNPLLNYHLVSEALEEDDWTFAGWSESADYYDSVTYAPITALADGSAATDIVYHAIYEHTRPQGSPVGTETELRYYSSYTETDTVLTADGYATEENVVFPDGVRYKMSIDSSRFYYFSLPFNCPKSYITFSNPGIKKYFTGIFNNKYVGDWLITRWDETQFCWHDMDSAEVENGLVAGVGYGIGLVTEANSDVFFHTAYNHTVTPLHNDTITISFTEPAENEYGYRSGWNFMGSRFYQAIDYTKMNTSYVLTANTNDLGWTLHSPYGENEESEFGIAPFSTFMVQTDRDLTYTPVQAQAIAAENTVNHFNIVIRQDEDAERMDYTTIVADSKHTDEYEIGMDMGKMLAQDALPQIYSVMDSSYYAINASGFGIGSKIKVGIYVPHKENWVVALGKNIEIPEGWHIILKDNSTVAKTDLTVEDYQFNLRKGLYPNRFEVEISEMPLGVEEVSVDSVCEPEWMRVVSVSGIVVYEGAFDLERLDGLTEGIYVVQTDVWTRKMIVKR